MKTFTFLTIFAAIAVATPITETALVERQGAPVKPYVRFYTEDSAGAGEVCHFDFPRTGYYADLTVTPTACQNFKTSFADPAVAQLANNVSFVWLPNQSPPVAESCRLYNTEDCTGKYYTASLGENELTCSESEFDNATNSFICDVYEG